MGWLIARTHANAVRWYWLTRYWYMDSESGHQWRIVGVCIGVLIVIMQLIKVGVAAALPPPPGEPVKAIYWWVVQLIIAIVAAIISYAIAPKPQPQKPTEDEGPTVEDGRSVLIVDGPYWIKDEFILANKVVGRVPIKSGGKK